MTDHLPTRRAGRLAALVTAVTLLVAPLAAAPAATASPTPQVTIGKIATRTAPYAKKALVKPKVTVKSHGSLKSKTLTVKKSGKTVVKNKKQVWLKPGTYRVTTKVTYRTNWLSASKKKVWSKLRTKSKTQTLVVKQGKKPSHTSPVSSYNCPKWAPIKGNQTTAHRNDWIYHVPGGNYYKVTKPEECFTTTSAARKAGYRASKNG